MLLPSVIFVEAAGWIVSKASDAVAQTVTDGGIKNILADKRKEVAAWLRGTVAGREILGDGPRSSATNHDLLRALRAAWVRVAQQKLGEVRKLQNSAQQSGEFRNWTGLPLMADTLGEELRHLDVVATRRDVPFVEASPVEAILLKVVGASSEQARGSTSAADSAAITSAFVEGILNLAVDWGELRGRVESIFAAPLILPRRGRPLEPGEAVLDQFVENLKSGLYPEASKAFEILVGGLIRGDITELRNQVSGLRSATAADSEWLQKGLPDAVAEAVTCALEAERHQLAEGLSRLEREQARLARMVGAREHDFVRTAKSVDVRRQQLMEYFFGRQEAEEQILARVESARNSLTVITAPAGTGKSGFMARLCQALEERGFAVAAHFASRNHEYTCDPVDTLGHLVLRLRALRDEEPLGRLDYDERPLAHEVDQHLSLDRPANRPLVVLVDGLDEMVSPLPLLIPTKDLGAHIHFIVSCRAGSNQERPPAIFDWTDPEAARRVGLNEPTELRFELPPLDYVSIALWLTSALNVQRPMDVLPLVDRIHASSEGLAIFVRYLLEDIRQTLETGDNIKEAHARMAVLPESFSEYLRSEIFGMRFGSRALSKPERKLLGILSAAYGPIEARELGALVPELDVQGLQSGLRRWCTVVYRNRSGGDAWSLQHPRLAAPLAEVLGYEADEAHELLEAWCRDVILTQPKNSGKYAALWGPRHLMSATENLRNIKEVFGNIDFLCWRLNLVPTRLMIYTIKSDYSELDVLAGRSGLGSWTDLARIFENVSGALAMEATE